jgi:transcriptional regulator with XRE-family HTH domain
MSSDPAPSTETPRRAPPLADVTSSVADRLRLLMARKGRSLEALAAYSGLSESSLNAVAAGDAIPPLNLLWRIANALGVPLGSLIAAPPRRGVFVLRKARKKVVSSGDGAVTSRALFPHDDGRLVEFYEFTIAPNHTANCEAHAPGTVESLIVARGQIEVTAGKDASHRLDEGDAMVFEGDVPHAYRNSGANEALIYLVMSYGAMIGA